MTISLKFNFAEIKLCCGAVILFLTQSIPQHGDLWKYDNKRLFGKLANYSEIPKIYFTSHHLPDKVFIEYKLLLIGHHFVIQ